jgi:hypothetical protein
LPPSLKEQQHVALLLQAADPGTGRPSLAKIRTHRILTDRLAEFGASSKLNAELPFLQMLKAGRRRSVSKVPWVGCGRALDRRYRRSSGGMLTMSPIDLIGFLGILVGLGGAACFEGAALAGITLACCIGLQRSAAARTAACRIMDFPAR